ncbi:hypothetical protein [Amycolatopsis anabasis]|uniref:hypothetical protein n=1 Tax=Amycolatopsis anabasis TaxID=1840409 RepID=UPI00131DD166|nr:hypothetical protein [Amycolatopsis anabasis]
MSSNEPVRGLRAAILRSWHNKRPNPNNPISGNLDYQEVFVVGLPVQGRPVQEGLPLVVLSETAPGCVVARPAEPCPSDRRGYQASGAYIVHSDCSKDWESVFGHRLPIPLHDHTERRLDS